MEIGTLSSALLFCEALGMESSEERECERTLKGVGRKRAWRID